MLLPSITEMDASKWEMKLLFTGEDEGPSYSNCGRSGGNANNSEIFWSRINNACYWYPGEEVKDDCKAAFFLPFFLFSPQLYGGIFDKQKLYILGYKM